MSAKSERMEISRLKRMGFWPVVGDIEVFMHALAHDAGQFEGQRRSGIGPSSVRKAWLVRKIRAASKLTAPPLISSHGVPLA